MFDFSQTVQLAISKFLGDFFNELITYFGGTLARILGTSLNVLQIPLVQNGIKYSQGLAFTILIIKSLNEGFQTYILHESGDPDQDPKGLVIRTSQAVAIIACLPWIVTQIFTFGSKVASDVSGLDPGQASGLDVTYITTIVTSTSGAVVAILGIVLVVLLLVVAIQATIRGAELALMSVLGPIMALNLTANNRNVWSAWFKQVVVICTAQALQIFMLEGALTLITTKAISASGLLLVFGWLWVTIKSPKYIQQFAYSTGFTGAIGGSVKQAGTMVLMRKMIG